MATAHLQTKRCYGIALFVSLFAIACDENIDCLINKTCECTSFSHATESGYPSNIQLNVAQDGQDGLDGQFGSGGTGGANCAGSIQHATWVPAPHGATPGQTGSWGGSGGGGGGGGENHICVRN